MFVGSVWLGFKARKRHMVSLCFLECKIPELKILSVTERLALPVSKRR